MGEELTYAEVAKHSTKKDIYVVVHDKVYNASSFVDEHPYVFFAGPPSVQSRGPTRLFFHRPYSFYLAFQITPDCSLFCFSNEN